MKHLITIISTVLMTTTLCLPRQVKAQSPEKMSYQAVVRDADDKLVTNQVVGMQISILQGSADGTAVYTEIHTPTTNANGLVSIEIGNGTVVSGNFSSINWANGSYFIKTETDPTGGTRFTIAGTSQLLSVPYALHAKTAESISDNDPEYNTDSGLSTSNLKKAKKPKLKPKHFENGGEFSGEDRTLGNKDNFALGLITNNITRLHITNDGYVGIGNVTPFTKLDVSGVITASGGASTNWNTAYSWGDHSTLGYLTSSNETDPVYTPSQAANITSTDITNLGNLSGVNTGNQDISGIATNASAIALNTAKVGYTDALVSANAAVVANTAKTGITTAQTAEITVNTQKVGYTDALVSANTDVVANTAKVGITTAQAAEITVNTAKVGYTDALVSANNDVVANTAKTGITTAQDAEITVNTAKAGYTDALVSANTDVAANTAKVGYTEALVSTNADVVANTAKMGISTTQADAITANTAKVGYTEALVSANANVVANTAKVGYAEALVGANVNVAANTAKVGLTPGTSPGDMMY